MIPIVTARGSFAIRLCSLLTPLVWGGTIVSVVSAAEPTQPPTFLTPKRTVPNVSPPVRGLLLGENPTLDEIKNCQHFPVPLATVGSQPNAEDTAALVAAIRSSFSDPAHPNIEPLAEFARQSPSNPWTPAVLVNAGLARYSTGWFSKAIDAYEASWNLAKSGTQLESRRIADRAMAEWMKMNARVGKQSELQAQFLAIKGRTPDYEAASLFSGCETALAMMQERPGVSFRCGPMALSRILKHQNAPGDWLKEILDTQSPSTGFSLEQVHQMAGQYGLKMQIAKRAPGSKVILPCVVHWKLDHYGALIRLTSEGLIHLQDPTFDTDTLLTTEALDHEASGYFLIPEGPLPSGWEMVTPHDASLVFGKGVTDGIDEDPTDCQATPHASMSCDVSCGLASYSINLMQVGLTVTDTPVSYSPPVGEKMNFTLRFHEKQPLGGESPFGLWQWTFNWMSWVDVARSSAEADVRLMSRSGGYRTFKFNTATGLLDPEYNSGAKIVLITETPRAYEITYPDGAKERFSFEGPLTTNNRLRVFLTQSTDPHGNTVNLTYDGNHRLVALTDAIGQVSSVQYGAGRISRITDPFGRFAEFQYSEEESGRLTSITDTVGLTSNFTYVPIGSYGGGGGVGNVAITVYGISRLTTPYGTTTFTRTGSGMNRRLMVTDPAGDAEVVELRNNAPGFVASESGPPGRGADTFMGSRNSFHWDKKSWKEAPSDYSKAVVYHWVHGANPSKTGNSIEGMKRPFENWVWYEYPGQNGSFISTGSHGSPSSVSRRMADGQAERTSTTYNSQGNPLSETDPMGRRTDSIYAANGIDLLEVRRNTGGETYAVLHQASYDARHLPLTTTDTAGQTTSYVWNALGQITSVRNPKNETTTFTYYAADAAGKQRMHRLHQVDAALPGSDDVTTFDYDAYGRIASVTGPDGYFVNLAYDALDRLTRITYPDASYDETTYHRLDPQTKRDRMGRITSYVYNSIRQLESVTDPANRTIGYRWCKCGDMRQLIDAMGRITSWKHDVGGRMTAKVYADGSIVKYAYRPDNGRLASITDAKGQIKNYSYDLDGSLTAINYDKEEHYTPDVKFTYDVHFRRLKTMKDGIGTTTYDYHPELPNALGAGQLARVDGPLVNDALTYTYDELGRRTGYAVNGVGESNTFDPLGRVTAVTNPLGVFDYAYVANTGRVSSVAYPGGMTAAYNYHTLSGDFRLKDIIHTLPGNTPLSRHSYEYNPTGNITRWTQINASAGINRSWLCGYDNADQLTSVTSQDPLTLAELPTGQYAYSYDPAGNRLSETINGSVTLATHNALNQLVAGNEQAPSSLTEQTYEWDANDRLIAVNYTGTNRRSEFQYDGVGRRSTLAEKEGNNIIDLRKFIWEGLTLFEERDTLGTNTIRRHFGRGLQVANSGGLQSQLLARDHLGSVRSAVSGTGELLATFEYNPWGFRAALMGVDETGLGFTGHFTHLKSGHDMAPYRTYNSKFGRWISIDPIAERGGINLYGYVSNNPINSTDPLGLKAWKCSRWSNTAIPVPHKFFCVSQPNGPPKCYSQCPGENGYGSDCGDQFNDKNCVPIEGSNDEFDSCLTDKANEERPPYLVLPFPFVTDAKNCIQWASGSIKLCMDKIK